MTKINKQRTPANGDQQQDKQRAGATTPAPTSSSADSPASSLPPAAKTLTRGKQGKKNEQPRIGGPAVPGAKSTQPRQINPSDPQQQQMASYNHDMRRRMQRMGIGAASSADAQKQRNKKLEKRKQRLEQRKQEVKRVTVGAPTKISLGRRNTYFIIGVALVIVAFIVIAILVNHFK